MDIDIRPMTAHAEFFECVRMQKETWGYETVEIVPPILLIVANKIGGLAAGAFDAANNMVGFVLSFAGFYNGKTINWSKMMAVRKDYRDRGLGRRLKLYQRAHLLAHGIDYIYWTYDPLVARNAHLNMNKLGVIVHEYAVKMYPDETGSTLQQGMPLDRFIVEWSLKHERVQLAATTGLQPDAQAYRELPIVNTELGPDLLPTPVDNDLPQDNKIRIEVPMEIEVIQAKRDGMANRWRLNTRRAFQHYLSIGYQVEAFYRDDGHCFYVLSMA